jgi:membrane-associated phospholipid phosphatase
VEIYWHALLRDVPFDDYATSGIVRQAADELSRLEGYRGPRDGGRVTPQLLFRGNTAGGATGPYISQFLIRDLPWTPIRVPQRIRTAAYGRDYMTTDAQWHAVQNGAIVEDIAFSDKPTYVRSGRDLGTWVHRDFTYQAFLGAALMLFKMSAPVDGGIPYHYSISQSGFVTYGPSDILHLVALVANLALKASWFQKWRLHMRLRPEEYAGRVQKHLTGKAEFPLPLDLLDSVALDTVRIRFKSAYAPQAYPEGAPLHPSYPAGHAAIAGACTTVLKACFAESFVIPDPSVPAPDGQSLRPYKEMDLTVGNELDKLAENISIGRDFAGVHWRSDATAGMLLGEAVAIRVLREMRLTSHEIFDGFHLRRFDGSRITVR